MIRFRHLALAVALLTGTCVCVASAPVVIGADRVTKALSEAGLKVDLSQVELPVSVPAADSNVLLRVQTWRKLDDKTIWVRLMCQRPKDCLPFFILLHSSDRQFFMHLPEASGSEPLGAPHRKLREPLLVRAGSRATLVLQRGMARITTPVTCLENGSLGRRIRVKNVTTKQVYSAEVVDRGILTAWLR